MGLRETLVALSEPDLSGDPRAAAHFDQSVGRLFDMVGDWISPRRRDHSVAVMRERFALVEQGYHQRAMPLLHLITLGHPVTMRPVGALVAGAKGRVDMLSGKGDDHTLRILLDPSGMTGWCVPGKVGHLPLDRTVFLGLLDRLADHAPDARAFA